MYSMTLDQQGLIPAAQHGTVSRRKAMLALHTVLLTALVCAGLLYPAVQLDAEQLIYPCCVSVLLSLVWILWSWYSLRGTLFEPYPLFMLSAGLFNGGQAILEVFGLNPDGILKGRVSPEMVLQALYLVGIGMMALHFGALIALRKDRRSEQALDTAGRRRATRMAGWILLGASAVPTIGLLNTSLLVVLDYGYMGLFRQQNVFSTPQALSAFFMPGIIFLLAGSRKHRWIQILCLFLAGTYAAIYLFLGSRGSAVMACVAVVWVFDRSIRRIPRSLIAVMVIAALIVIPLVRVTRGTIGRDRLSLTEQIDALSNLDDPVSSSIAEMGYSLVTVAHTVQLVPSVRGFDWGTSYLYAALAILPNLGWDVHPSVAHGLLGDWLIRTVDPTVAAGGGGLGFSFLAEAYLNFGWIGAPLWLGVVGFILCLIFARADGNDPARHAVIASFLSFFFLFSRGESATVARGLVWYAAVPYILAAVLTVRANRRVRNL
jgi:oligosaccharide repeat unit polymerase